MEDFVLTEQTTPEVEPELEFPMETTEESSQEFSLKVKYNGAEQELTREEAVAFAQKGMNYDHIKEQLDQLKNAPENDISESRFQQLRRELDEMHVRSIAERKWNEFRREHGEFQEYAALPEEVRMKVAAGMELDAAYALYENRQLKIRMKQMEQNLRNTETAPGSIGSNGAAEAADDFLKGFFGM